jgi:hypothetical protein
MNSYSVIKTILISSFLFTATFVFGQTSDGAARRDTAAIKRNGRNAESRREISAPKRMPLFFLKNELLRIAVPNFKLGLQNGNFQNDFSPWNNLQSNIATSYKILQSQGKNTDLEFVGKSLRYINFAAAIGLAAYSVHKYGFWGEKIPKRKKQTIK